MNYRNWWRITTDPDDKNVAIFNCVVCKRLAGKIFHANRQPPPQDWTRDVWEPLRDSHEADPEHQYLATLFELSQ